MPETEPLMANGSTDLSWWRHAAIYQVYVRSFADGNADGTGDIAGVRSRLQYLADLGVDAIWFNPWYPSPMADAGYDIADYRDIEPVFGTLPEAEALIAEAHALGIRVIIDIVPNHGSDEHAWFKAALAGGPEAPERDLFWFRPGKGGNGELPPNDWNSIFGGPAWTRSTNPDGGPGEWYLHLFAPEQPDWNWDNPKVHEEFEAVLRFWLDRGVDGIRIDSAALLIKDASLGDFTEGVTEGQHPFIDIPAVHDVYRAWRRLSDSYPGERILIGEVWLPDRERFTQYLRPDELHTAFNFDFLGAAWDAARMRSVIEGTLADHAPAAASPTWVLSNHDVVRHVTRYGRGDTSFSMDNRRLGEFSDFELGTRRARAAILVTFALPGAVYVYQGEELGLSEVEDLPEELLQDPIWPRSGYTDKGRDGARVPIPWSGDASPFGFNSEGVEPWLPQPAEWKSLTVAAEDGDPDSMLELYRSALHCRRQVASLALPDLSWLPTADGVLGFARGDDFVCVANTSGGPVDLPPHKSVLLSSVPLVNDQLPSDAAVWLKSE
ncbi:MAG: alpha-glucosidase [Frankiales bacterium]|nr:alpha-glucosidase [Frankiales bacterium]